MCTCVCVSRLVVVVVFGDCTCVSLCARHCVCLCVRAHACVRLKKSHYVRLCLKCVCVCVGGGWGLGGMELWIGSNTFFLCILQLLIRHMYFIFCVCIYIYIVSCHILLA